MMFSGMSRSAYVTPDFIYSITYLILIRDMCRWAVRLGRHPFEKISKGPKVQFKRDRNPLKRAKP